MNIELPYIRPINPYSAYEKLIRVIYSCTTEQHFDATAKLIDNLYPILKKHRLLIPVSYHFTEKLGPNPKRYNYVVSNKYTYFKI